MPSEDNLNAETLDRVEAIIRRDLKLGPDLPVTPEMPFFGGDADIDSLDILLLLSSVEKEFGLRIPSEAVGREVFANVGTLVRYIQHNGGDAKSPSASAVIESGADVLSRLPHTEPFRFVSSLLQHTAGESAVGVWRVSGSEAFFAGHFPGQPIVPGVLLAEALAQVSGLIVGDSSRGHGRLAHVDLRFEQAVIPPADVQLQSRLTRTLGALRQFDVTATVAGQIVARGAVAISFE
jgi:3-hydroxyacyl-[acyl-carrier-protein] dehydratase